MAFLFKKSGESFLGYPARWAKDECGFYFD
jgi:hypothetical protein